MTFPIHARLFAALGKFFPGTCAIQQATETQDAYNQPIKSWGAVTGLGSLACRLMTTAARGYEVKGVRQVYSTATHVVMLTGCYPAITPKMRAVIGGQAYDILAVQHDGNQVVTELVCEIVK